LVQREYKTNKKVAYYVGLSTHQLGNIVMNQHSWTTSTVCVVAWICNKGVSVANTRVLQTSSFWNWNSAPNHKTRGRIGPQIHTFLVSYQIKSVGQLSCVLLKAFCIIGPLVHYWMPGKEKRLRKIVGTMLCYYNIKLEDKHILFIYWLVSLDKREHVRWYNITKLKILKNDNCNTHGSILASSTLSWQAKGQKGAD
jgi:hypothetical protein